MVERGLDTVHISRKADDRFPQRLDWVTQAEGWRRDFGSIQKHLWLLGQVNDVNRRATVKNADASPYVWSFSQSFPACIIYHSTNVIIFTTRNDRWGSDWTELCPRVVQSVCSGETRKGAEVSLQCFCSNLEATGWISPHPLILTFQII